MTGQYAYVTLVTNASYALGALALARSLRAVASQWPLLVLTTRGADADSRLAELEAAGATILQIEDLAVSDSFKDRHSRKIQQARSPLTNLRTPLFHDPLDNFCKLRLWELSQYERVVFLAADTLVVKNIDRLFGYPEFSAAPHLHETLTDMHRLNSGVFVAKPNTKTFESMLQALDAPQAYWPRTDQTFLENWFPHWHGLPYTFNTLQYVFFKLPQLWHWSAINVVHYHAEKPWQEHNPRQAELRPLIDLWHQIFDGAPPPSELRSPHI